MALPTGGPLPDYVSQTQYAAEKAKQAQSEQRPAQQSVTAERQGEQPKLSKEELAVAVYEKNLAINDRVGTRNSAERGVMTDKARASNEAKALQIAAEIKQEQGQGLTADRTRSNDKDLSR